MAYLVELINKCNWATCNSRPTYELFDRWNGPLGKYCTRHAKVALKARAKSEGENNG